MTYDDALLRRILTETKTIACVGMSRNQARPSYYVSEFLTQRGFRVIPVNPVYEGQRLLGETVRPNLRSIDDKGAVDMVDIFRKSEDVLPVVQEALDCLPCLKVIWMQLGIENAEAAALAEQKGITVIQNRCPKIEYPRLIGA
ncbi:CoA-binding protein [Falsihalocynthiibacter sp. SS001]|uniref:CoA-binding protein n=1 Tax=Falsihalocynthiibacter sp. SS001 TaxID=3349698 RepID=UPI0036D26931